MLPTVKLLKMEGWWLVALGSKVKENGEPNLTACGDHENVSPQGISRHQVGEDFELLGEELVFVSVVIAFDCKKEISPSVPLLSRPSPDTTTKEWFEHADSWCHVSRL